MNWLRVILVFILAAAGRSAGALSIAKPIVLPLQILDGDRDDPSRIFGVGVFCNDMPATFEIGCMGPTRISESFAKKCAGTIEPEQGEDIERDPSGKPVMAGNTHVKLRLAGLEFDMHVRVMRDAYYQKPENEGMLGFDVFQQFQWELDPTKPTLTLRPLGTPPASRPLALIPLRIEKQAFVVRVQIRNRVEEMALLPASSFIQVGPVLQRALDFNSGKAFKPEVSQFGEVRAAWMRGDDTIELVAGIIRDTDLRVALMPAQKVVVSGLGQCLLNRFVYCVEPKRGQLRIMSRVAGPTTRPGLRQR